MGYFFRKIIQYNNIFLIYIFISLCFSKELDFKLRTHTINNVVYLDIAEFIELQNLKSNYFDSKEKLEIQIDNNKIFFSPYSSFCKINKKIFHLNQTILYKNNKLLIPAVRFYKILQANNMPYKIYKVDEQFIYCASTQHDIDKFHIDIKNNGILIQLETKSNYAINDIATSQSNSGWFNITILNCALDSLALKNIPLKSPIKKIELIQSQESAQLSFLIDSKIESTDIEINNNFINIMLRTSIQNNANQIIELRKQWLIDTIVLDPGHGGKDPGAIGYNKLKEKTVTLDVAKKLGQMIERKLGINVIYTREKDVFVPLWKRTKLANQSDGKLFISIHANSSAGNKSVKGFETYLLRSGKIEDAIEVAERENGVINMEKNTHQYTNFKDENFILASITQNSFMKESERFASLIQKHMDSALNSNNRGVKQAGFHVLVGASMPNVLIEIGFLSNKKESKQLEKGKYRKLIATAIYKAIEEFVKINNSILEDNEQ